MYPWSDPHVISFIVVGFVTLVAFVLWECYAPLREPFVPMKLFKDGKSRHGNLETFKLSPNSGRWAAACVLVGIGAGVYYAFAIVWPAQVAVVYTQRRRAKQKLNLRQTFALSDRGWGDITILWGAYRQDKGTASRYLKYAACLLILSKW